MKIDNNLILGVIVKAQGIKGEVKVKPFTDTPDDLCRLKHVIIDGKKVNIVKSRCDKTMAYILFEGVADRNEAETLRLKEVSVLREHAPKPQEGRHYVSDLLGCEVFDDGNKLLGKLADIIQGGGSDVYVIKHRGKEILVPALKSVIQSINIEEKKIMLVSDRLKEVAVYDD